MIALDSVNQTLDAPPAYMSGATKLKNMIEQTDELIVCPGVYDGLSARIALRVGFSAMYMVSLHTHHKIVQPCMLTVS